MTRFFFFLSYAYEKYPSKIILFGKNAGFTLLELLVVVLIIGILAAIAVPKYEMSVKKARVMKMVPLLKALVNAEELYWSANGKYTPYIHDLSIDFPPGVKLQGWNDTGYVKLPDGTVLDLLTNAAYISTSNSYDSLVEALIPINGKTITYRYYLRNSAYPNRRYCTGDAALCKSLGGYPWIDK